MIHFGDNFDGSILPFPAIHMYEYAPRTAYVAAVEIVTHLDLFYASSGKRHFLLASA